MTTVYFKGVWKKSLQTGGWWGEVEHSRFALIFFFLNSISGLNILDD